MKDVEKYLDHADKYNDKKYKPIRHIYTEGNNVIETEDLNYDVGQ
jgi:hypothetical protein